MTSRLAQETGELGGKVLDWRTAALIIGEQLAAVGPNNYYQMTADEWVTWAREALGRPPVLGLICPWKCQSCGATGRIVRRTDDSKAKVIWRRGVSHGVTRRKCKTPNLIWTMPWNM
jgi:hypothetical protein